VSEFIKRDIADYVIAALAANHALDDVKLFIRGGTPMPVATDRHPFSEVLVGSEEPDGELSGNVYDQVYTGIVTFNVLLLKQADADWLEMTGDRTARLRSYDQVEELVKAARDELQREAHKEMGGLTSCGERVVLFAVTGPRVYGLEPDARTDSYTNFGSLTFEVATERVG
jgi:hypothetical protein